MLGTKYLIMIMLLFTVLIRKRIKVIGSEVKIFLDNSFIFSEVDGICRSYAV